MSVESEAHADGRGRFQVGWLAYITGTFFRRNLARRHTELEADRMAIVAVAVLLGVVLFDAHDFVNRRTHRS